MLGAFIDRELGKANPYGVSATTGALANGQQPKTDSSARPEAIRAVHRFVETDAEMSARVRFQMFRHPVIPDTLHARYLRRRLELDGLHRLCRYASMPQQPACGARGARPR